MVMLDDQLDAYISLALESQTVVTRRQQSSAWLRLRRQARITPRLSLSAHQPWLSWQRVASLWRGLRHLLLSEEIYHRAAQHRHFTSTLPMQGDLMLCYDPFYSHKSPRRISFDYCS